MYDSLRNRVDKLETQAGLNTVEYIFENSSKVRLRSKDTCLRDAVVGGHASPTAKLLLESPNVIASDGSHMHELFRALWLGPVKTKTQPTNEEKTE